MMAMSNEDALFKMEKLNTDNYHSWKFSMKMFLIGKDLWEIVQGTEILPREAAVCSDAQKKFVRRCNQALATICLNISNSLQVYVRSVTTAKEAWDILAKHFEENTLTKKIFYRRKLYNARMEKGTDMQTHVNYLKTISEHLEAIDDKVEEKDLVIILLSSLPEEYNHLVTALETIAEDKLTSWTYVRDRVIAEYYRKYGDSSSKGGQTDGALFADRKKGKGGHNQNKKNDKYKNNLSCHTCHQKGHFSRECPSKRKDNVAGNGNGYVAQASGNMSNVSPPEFALETGGDEDESWWIDSGASQHMSSNKNEFSNYKQFTTPLEIKLADNSVLFSYGKGDVYLTLYNNGEKFEIVLNDVLFVPQIRNKLLSLPVVIQKGAEVKFVRNSVVFVMNDKSYDVGHKHGKLFKLNTVPFETCCMSSVNVSPEIWHMRYCHLGYDNLKILSGQNMVKGLDMTFNKKINDCEGCIMGKHMRTSFPKKSINVSTNVLELIHSDVVGPFNVDSLGGSRYFVTFIDDFSRYHTVYMMKHKSEVFEKFKQFVSMSENLFRNRVKKILFGNCVKKLRSDNGGEYSSNDLEQFCNDRGIIRETTVPYTPQQNGIAERANRTLMEMVRSMLHHGNMPLKFWAEALSTAVYLKNRSPTSCFTGQTPYERWFNEKPTVAHLKVFGCTAYAHIPDVQRKKLDKKSQKCVFIGYPEGCKGFKLFNPVKGTIFRSRDVIFLEKQFYYATDEPNKLLVEKDIPEVWFNKLCFENEQGIADNEVVPVVPAEDIIVNNPVLPDVDVDIPNFQEVENDTRDNVVRKSVRVTRAPERYGWEHANFGVSGEPQNMKEALEGRNWKKWKEASDVEYKALMKNKTWDLVNLPSGKNVVGSKWVFTTKHDSSGNVDRYKARLVAQGYSQEHGVDYHKVFAPVVRYASIRTILAIANQHDLEVHQMDVCSAFLNGNLDEDIYMAQPEGYVDQNNPNLVCKLKKSIYGLKQAARCWNDVLHEYLLSDGYKRSDADPCVYTKIIKKNGRNVIMLIAVYVDDTILASNDKDVLSTEKEKLSERFEMDDRGEIHYLLGMRIQRDRNSKILTIDQSLYLEKVLDRFGMLNCNPVSTPLETGKKFQKVKENDEVFDTQLYQSAVGSLIYATICTRPDLCASVGVLSQHMAKPGSEHWSGIKRIFRYLKGTLTYGLKFVASDDFQLYGYSDSDWAGDVETRKSTSGYVFRLGGATISWRSKKQSVVALSSTEAEYIALASAVQEAVWLRNLLSDLTSKQVKPTVIYEDNQGAIALCKNPIDHSRMKHIDIKFHYTRDAVNKNVILVEYCTTKDMVADAFTKGLPRPAFEKLRVQMGVDAIK